MIVSFYPWGGECHLGIQWVSVHVHSRMLVLAKKKGPTSLTQQCIEQSACLFTFISGTHNLGSCWTSDLAELLKRSALYLKIPPP